MNIQITWREIDNSEALGTYVNEQITHALRHWPDSFGQVSVHLHDDNATKGGADDKRCVIKAKPRGAEPLVVESSGSDLYRTVNNTAKKLERSARHFIDRRRNH